MAIDIAKLRALESHREAVKRHTLMVVDDEPLIVESMAMMLEEDYQVIQADCGETALNLLREGGVAECLAMIISDQRMPGMSGVDLLREAASCAPRTIRMMVSGHMDFADLVAAVNEAQIHFFMSKPVHFEELLTTIRRGIALYERGLEPFRRIAEMERRLEEGRSPAR